MGEHKIKECSKHGRTKHVFTKDRWRCLKCLGDSVKRRRQRLKELSLQYKGGRCQCCGYDKCAMALEFHHIDPKGKDFGIGANGYTKSWEKVKKELDKCVLVCSNCHREIHTGIRECPKFIIQNEVNLQSAKKKVVKKRHEGSIPSLDELINAFKEIKTFSGVGLFFGVTDNGVRKWCKKYGIPSRTKEMLTYIGS